MAAKISRSGRRSRARRRRRSRPGAPPAMTSAAVGAVGFVVVTDEEGAADPGTGDGHGGGQTSPPGDPAGPRVGSAARRRPRPADGRSGRRGRSASPAPPPPAGPGGGVGSGGSRRPRGPVCSVTPTARGTAAPSRRSGTGARSPPRRARRSSASCSSSSSSSANPGGRPASRNASTGSASADGITSPPNSQMTVRSLNSSWKASPLSMAQMRPSEPRSTCPPLRSVLLARMSNTHSRRSASWLSRVVVEREVVDLGVERHEQLHRAGPERAVEPGHRRRHDLPPEGDPEPPRRDLPPPQPGREVPQRPLAPLRLVHAEHLALGPAEVDEERAVGAPRHAAPHVDRRPSSSTAIAAAGSDEVVEARRRSPAPAPPPARRPSPSPTSVQPGQG